MSKKFARLLAFWLIFALLISLFSLLPVGAAEEEERFVFHALRTEQGKEYPVTSEPIVLEFDGQAVFSTMGLSLLEGDTNALFVSLYNYSNATKIRVSYTYEIYGVPSVESAEYELDAKANEKQSFILELPHIGVKNGVKELEISFLGEKALTGSVALNAMFNISAYVRNMDEEATFSRCHYDEKTGEIQIQGSLSYAATVRYEGESLALFALAEGEDLHLSSKMPVARTGISFNFSFAVEAESSDDLFSRYVVAAVTSKGERIPLCMPTYPSLTASLPSREQGFKGLGGVGLGEMIDVAPDVSVIDVYLNRLIGTSSDGILYAGEYDYYYFNHAYLSELDTQIQNLVGIGAHVYLRLLIDGGSTGLSFVDDAPDGVKYRLPVIRTKQAQRDLFALIDFVSERYSKENVISGLILGRAADLTEKYSYCAASNLAEYATLYATTLNLIAGAARQNLPALRVILPVSDRVFGESITAWQSGKNHYATLFLPSLLSALEAQVLAPQPFSLLLESYSLTDRVGGENTTVFGTDRINELLAFIRKASQKSTYLQSGAYFSWQPQAGATQAQLRADYLLKYAALYQNGTISAFLLDLSDGVQNKECSEALIHMAKYINTDRYDEFCNSALELIGLNSITEAYPGLQSASLRQRGIFATALSANGYTSGASVTGRYSFWDFSVATDTLGWYAGNGCTSLSVISREDESHAMHATLVSKGDYADLSYHFATPVDLTFAPLWKSELSVIGRQGARYELQIRLIGDQSVACASAIVTAGESQQLYLDLAKNTAALHQLRGVRVMARPLDTQDDNFEVLLSKITLESPKLSDAELTQRVEDIRQSINEETDAVIEKKDYRKPILITGVIVLMSVALTVLLGVSYRIKRKRQK